MQSRLFFYFYLFIYFFFCKKRSHYMLLLGSYTINISGRFPPTFECEKIGKKSCQLLWIFFWKICCSLNSLYKTLVILFYTHILLDTLMTTPMGESLCHLVRLDVNLMLRAFFHGFYFIGSQVLSFFCWVFCMFKRTLVRGLLARVS